MENNIENALDNLIGVSKSEDEKKNVDKKKIIKSDFTIIERVDKIIIAENGKQLLREQY